MINTSRSSTHNWSTFVLAAAIILVLSVCPASAQQKAKVILIGQSLHSKTQVVKPVTPNINKDVAINFEADSDTLVMFCSSSEIVIFHKGELLWHSVASEKNQINTSEELGQNLKHQDDISIQSQRFSASHMNSIHIPIQLSKKHRNAMELRFSEPSSGKHYTLDGRPFTVRYDSLSQYWSVSWKKRATLGS